MHSMLHNTNPRPLLTPSVPRPRHFSGAGRTIEGRWRVANAMSEALPQKAKQEPYSDKSLGCRYSSIWLNLCNSKVQKHNTTELQSTDKNKLAQIRHTIASCLTNHATSFQSSVQASHQGSPSHITNDGANTRKKKTAAMRNTARMGSQLLHINT